MTDSCLFHSSTQHVVPSTFNGVGKWDLLLREGEGLDLSSWFSWSGVGVSLLFSPSCSSSSHIVLYDSIVLLRSTFLVHSLCYSKIYHYSCVETRSTFGSDFVYVSILLQRFVKAFFVDVDWTLYKGMFFIYIIKMFECQERYKSVIFFKHFCDDDVCNLTISFRRSRFLYVKKIHLYVSFDKSLSI